MIRGPIVALIPARGGSQRIPRKNAARLHGRPLLSITIEHALRSRYVDTVYVSTDDTELAAIARTAGAEVILRPDALASATVGSEPVLAHALSAIRGAGIEPELVAFLQCTSPLRRVGELDGAIEFFSTRGADSLVSVTRSTDFLWTLDTAGEPRAMNYDPSARPRTQDMPPQYRENGSIYLFRPWVLDKLENRIGGRTVLYEMDYWSSFEIDTPEDLELCRWRVRMQRERPPLALPHPIDLLVLDFDGVFTDNTVYVDENGHESVRCSRADGLGLDRLRRLRVPMLVLSSERNPVVAARCKKLDLPVLQDIEDKSVALSRILAERSLAPERVVYVGNDSNDLECMKLVGCSVAVGDATAAVREVADWVLKARGGRGALRELCDTLADFLAAEGHSP